MVALRWTVHALRHSLDFQSRAQRSEYWYFVLVTTLIGVACLGVDLALGTFSIEMGLGVVSAASGLMIMIPSIAVHVRRLHDANFSAAWLLLLVIPVLGVIVLAMMLCVDGSPAANRFGPDPKSLGARDPAET